MSRASSSSCSPRYRCSRASSGGGMPVNGMVTTIARRGLKTCRGILRNICSSKASACVRRSTCSRACRSRHPRNIVDLGCGSGNVTRLLGERWPDAQIVGVDSSPSMLEQARTATRGDPRFTFVAADLAHWHPAAPVDLVYSNAALHWLPDHAALFARVCGNGRSRGRARGADAGQFSRAVAHADRRPGAQRTLAEAIGAHRARAARRRCRFLFRLARPGDARGRYLAHGISAGPCRREPMASIRSRRGPRARGSFRSSRRSMCRSGRNSCATTCGVWRATIRRRSDGRTLFPFRRLFIVATRPNR